MKEALPLILALTLLPGCTRYFRVTDPGSDREYYTTKISRTRTGAVRFRDLRSDAEVTLQSSEVQQIHRADMPEDLAD